ncbi:MAG TPA: N-acetyl-1-D-myo-inositol-2-amino-2-deoxy-alpha-D-glucopyranoside deacetylase [Candidatus Binatia bacterium]|nr:N-acetyl-1-D-myo-inositol-2-amino-2-deoxy-alpha-D-glucopyranoside deacetylase [Candidatus Binatia bacterium]
MQGGDDGLARGLRLLTVHAHPDDETITMGGLLAQCADRGVATSVVCCTDGKVATIFDPEYAANEPEIRPRLKEIRADELRRACQILGVSEVNFLDYGDSGMAGTDTNNLPGAFWQVDMDEAVRRVVAHIRRFRPHVVVTYDSNGGYGHPDHIQAHRVTLLAVEAAYHALYPELGPSWRVSKLYYTAFPLSEARRAVEMARVAGMKPPFGETDPDALEFITPDEWVTTVVNVRDQLARKREALLAHRSQLTEDFALLSVPEAVLREHFFNEHYQLVVSRVPTALPESDVFAGVVEAEQAG